jgi:hypothetical protein
VRVVFALVVVVAFVVIVALNLKSDVVADYRVLGSCYQQQGVAPSTVASTLDTSACVAPPQNLQASRGWPVLTFVVDGQAGLDPQISGVRSDKNNRTVSIEYAGPSGAAGTSGTVLVFLEIPESALPPVPFAISDDAGKRTVASLPS